MNDVEIRVRGFQELQRALRRAPRDLRLEVRRTLREVAEPVRRDAESLARANIRRIGVPWSQMRVGVTQKVVYIAPRQRGVKSRTDRSRRRPNLFDLLMGRAMEPAGIRNEALVVGGLEHALDVVGRKWEQA